MAKAAAVWYEEQSGGIMPATIEIRGFLDLYKVFQERHWSNPREIDIPGDLTGYELLDFLDIPKEMIEVLFVNGKAVTPDVAVVRSGDRVALAPPGVPGPYRVLLGFRKMD